LSLHLTFLRSKEIFLFTDFIQGVRSTHHDIQCISSAISSGIMRPGRETDHSPLTSANFKNTWSYTSAPPYNCILTRHFQIRNVDLTNMESSTATVITSCRILLIDRCTLCGRHIHDIWQCVMLMVCYCIMLSDSDAISSFRKKIWRVIYSCHQFRNITELAPVITAVHINEHLP
jgi:hypothetical protein